MGPSRFWLAEFSVVPIHFCGEMLKQKPAFGDRVENGHTHHTDAGAVWDNILVLLANKVVLKYTAALQGAGAQ